MVARAAEGNSSIFCQDGLKDLDEVIVAYLKLAVDYDNSPSNTKYCVQNMLKELQETPRGKRFLECQTLEQIWLVFSPQQQENQYSNLNVHLVLFGIWRVTADKSS